jgi:putative Holliday junction resolvase
MSLDLGDKRVGVALANLNTLIANPLITLTNDESLIIQLKGYIESLNVQLIVVGLPRSLSGDDTTQTKKIRAHIKALTKDLEVNIVTQDEALSSVRAEEELKRRGKIYAKEEVDKLAACLILEDYIKGLGA